MALLAAAVQGFAIAEVGISIQHDANHGAFSQCAPSIHDPWLFENSTTLHNNLREQYPHMFPMLHSSRKRAYSHAVGVV